MLNVNRSTLRNWLRAVPAKVLLVLLLTALVSVLVFAVSELAFQSITGQREAAYRSMVGQTTLLRLKERLVQAESAQRGYLLTQQPRYLAPYEKAVQEARSAQASLVVIFGSDPALRRPIEEMGMLMQRKLDELDVTVRLARDRQPGWIKAILHTDVELGLMERVEQQSNQINAMLSTRAKEHLGALTELFRQQRLGVGLVVFLNLGFLAALGATLVRNFYEREQQQRELTRHAHSLEAAVDRRTQELSELSTYLQNSAEQERRTLARDLHDEFGALLTSAKLDVAWLQGRSAAAAPEMMGRLQQLSDSLDEAVNLKRRVIESLRPSLLDHLGLSAALQWYVQDTCDRADLACDVVVPDDDAHAVPQRVAIDLYRLVQEAINNTIKHAQASVVEVHLQSHAGHWHLSIKDDGIGMPSQEIEHLSHGLAGMRHRVRALGGQFNIVSTPAKGTEVRAWVPLQGG
jgi:signal transduction histidine kinase